MDNKWQAAQQAVAQQSTADGGIGTLRERTLHAVLKQWIDPDPTHHEVPLEGLVADVFDGHRVTEIQTRQLYTLKPKLQRLLPQYAVTVVHPIAYRKTLVWVDPTTGDTTAPRRSPKTGRVWDAFHELYALREFLTHPQLTVRLVLVDLQEVRLRDGWSRDGKRGSHRTERLPGDLHQVVELHNAADYAALLPDEWDEPFTTVDVRKRLKVRPRLAGEIVNVLYSIGVIQRTGKRGNAFLYERSTTGA